MNNWRKKQQWVDCERGRNYDEYMRRLKIYMEDDTHSKLEWVEQKINDWMDEEWGE